MDLFQFAFFYKFDEKLSFLADFIALKEPWGYSNPSKELAEGNNAASYHLPILRNYLEHTFRKVKAENKILYTPDKGYALVGDRDIETATFFMKDVAERLKGKVQLTTDGLKAYLNAVDAAFPTDDEVDFAQLVKLYGPEAGTSSTERKYSPAECTGSKKIVIYGQPDEKFISTSHIERQNLTMRMHMRRFTRLTNGFSKKIENHGYAIALHFVYYNFAKIHKTLRVTPAMAAGLTKRFMSIEDIVNLTDRKAPQLGNTPV